jgi:hypothetical protein
MIGALVITGWLVTACSSKPPALPATLSPSPGLTNTPLVFQRPPTPTTTVYPPTQRRISFNSAVEGVYVPGQVRELYILHNDRPRRISLSFETRDDHGPLHLWAQVYTPDGALVPQVSGQPLERSEWDVLAAGDYIIQVFGPETGARAFTLTATSRPIPEPADYSIAYGQSRSGEIAARGQRDRWTFQGRAGDHIQVVMTAPSGDGYLALYSSDGQLIGQDDDHPRLGQDPVLDLVLPVDGVYTILAWMYGDETIGAYRLTLERISEN